MEFVRCIGSAIFSTDTPWSVRLAFFAAIAAGYVLEYHLYATYYPSLGWAHVLTGSLFALFATYLVCAILMSIVLVLLLSHGGD